MRYIFSPMPVLAYAIFSSTRSHTFLRFFLISVYWFLFFQHSASCFISVTAVLILNHFLTYQKWSRKLQKRLKADSFLIRLFTFHGYLVESGSQILSFYLKCYNVVFSRLHNAKLPDTLLYKDWITLWVITP